MQPVMFVMMLMVVAVMVVMTMLMIVTLFLAKDLDLHVSTLNAALYTFLRFYLNPRYSGTVYGF